ncbi:Small ubiquitin- modifier 1 [Parelaphostrongylus tenuis]|uniref:Small ubiquitin- modifier 1 n=1 Tax=Parelaphostrongylus tenuis TaxID=148309 RepID=A0AAD5LW80_PARTN|nr:Small ubiquitin- modifier 1 [Parelaphostrongylus tenuis]
MANSGSEAPAASNSAVEHITLRVVDQNSDELHFFVKVGTAIGRIKRSYANRFGVAISSFRFLYNGRRLNDDDTPKNLNMENNDVIEVIFSYAQRL